MRVSHVLFFHLDPDGKILTVFQTFRDDQSGRPLSKGVAKNASAQFFSSFERSRSMPSRSYWPSSAPFAELRCATRAPWVPTCSLGTSPALLD